MGKLLINSYLNQQPRSELDSDKNNDYSFLMSELFLDSILFSSQESYLPWYPECLAQFNAWASALRGVEMTSINTSILT